MCGIPITQAFAQTLKNDQEFCENFALALETLATINYLETYTYVIEKAIENIENDII